MLLHGLALNRKLLLTVSVFISTSNFDVYEKYTIHRLFITRFWGGGVRTLKTELHFWKITVLQPVLLNEAPLDL